MKKVYVLAISALILSVLLVISCSPGIAQDGNVVQVNYTGKLEDGTIFDSSSGKIPLEFKLGEGRIIPGFENAVLGMKVGEKKTVTIQPDEAYGPYRPELAIDVPLSQLPAGTVPQVGQMLQSQLEDGSVMVVTITKVGESAVTVDANHPLAGKNLVFDIELLKIL